VIAHQRVRAVGRDQRDLDIAVVAVLERPADVDARGLGAGRRGDRDRRLGLSEVGDRAIGAVDAGVEASLRASTGRR
jgi:hypothetical protein